MFHPDDDALALLLMLTQTKTKGNNRCSGESCSARVSTDELQQGSKINTTDEKLACREDDEGSPSMDLIWQKESYNGGRRNNTHLVR